MHRKPYFILPFRLLPTKSIIKILTWCLSSNYCSIVFSNYVHCKYPRRFLSELFFFCAEFSFLRQDNFYFKKLSLNIFSIQLYPYCVHNPAIYTRTVFIIQLYIPVLCSLSNVAKDKNSGLNGLLKISSRKKNIH